MLGRWDEMPQNRPVLGQDRPKFQKAPQLWKPPKPPKKSKKGMKINRNLTQKQTAYVVHKTLNPEISNKEAAMKAGYPAGYTPAHTKGVKMSIEQQIEVAIETLDVTFLSNVKAALKIRDEAAYSSDKLKAIQLLNKMLKYTDTDNSKLTNNNALFLIFNKLSTAEVKALASAPHD